MVLGVFEGADHEKDIVVSLFHRLKALFGSYCQKGAELYRNLNNFCEVELGAAARIFQGC